MWDFLALLLLRFVAKRHIGVDGLAFNIEIFYITVKVAQYKDFCALAIAGFREFKLPPKLKHTNRKNKMFFFMPPALSFNYI